MDLSITGLWILMLAWAIQAAYSLHGKNEIQTAFLITYAWGALILVLDGFVGTGLTMRGWQNLAIILCLTVITIKKVEHKK